MVEEDGSHPIAVSIIIPIYNEAGSIQELYREINDVMTALDRSYEIVFVNDGSLDGSTEILERLRRIDPCVRLLQLKRNYGQTAAIMAGFDHARGDIIVPMDGDLQNDPRDIPRLLDKIEQGFDMVSGWRRQRKDPPLRRRFVSFMANKFISLLSGVKLNDYGCSLKAYRRDFVKGIKLYGEMHRFLPIYASWEGARIAEIVVNHRPRKYGRSHYGLERTYKVLFDLIVIVFMDRYLGKPLYLFGGFGLANFFVAFISVITSVYFKLWGGKTFIETPLPLLAVMTFITGTMCILMGLLAEMIIRIYYETRKRKIYLVDDSPEWKD